MDNRHVIGQAIFDIRFSSEEEAMSQQAALGEFIRYGLLPVIDEVFSEVSEPDIVIRLDCLEIDLGAVTFDTFSSELKNKLGELLRSTVNEMRVPSAPENEGRIISGGRRELRMLFFFLEHGYMPWYAERTDSRALEGLMQRVLKGNAPRFFSYLRSARQRETVLARIAGQFSDDVLAEIVRSLTPSPADFPVLLARALIRGVTETVGISSRMSADAGRMVWTALMAALLDQSEGELDGEKLVNSLLVTLREHGWEKAWTFALREFDSTAGLPVPLLESLKKSGAFAVDPVSGHGSRPAPATRRLHLRRRVGEALSRGEAWGVRGLWPMLVRFYPYLLIREVRRHGRPAAARRRIAEGFPESMLGDIVVLLEPAESAFIGEIAGRPELFRRAADFAREDEDEIRKRLWEFTLGYLLEERGSLFNRKSYLATLVRQMAEYGNIGFRELLGAVHGVMAELDVPSRLKGELLELLGELAVEAGLMLQAAAPDDREPREPAPVEALRKLIAEALTHGRPECLAPLWPMLLREKPLLLAEALRRHGRLATVRRRIAANFPEAMIKDFVVLLEPAESELIGEIAGRPELFRRAADFSREDKDETGRRVWEFTLGYLLDDSGSIFNRKSYMRSMARQMAAHGNVDFPAMLMAMREALPGVNVRSALQGELLELIDELIAETSEGPGLHEEAKKKADTLRSCDIVDMLRRRLTYGESAPLPWDGDFPGALEELAARHPELLRMFFHEIRNGGFTLRKMLSACSTGELSRVIELFLAFVQGADREKLSGFLSSVTDWAVRSGDSRRFLVEVLELLVLDRNIDCEELARRKYTAGRRKGQDETATESETAEHVPVSPDPEPEMENPERCLNSDSPIIPETVIGETGGEPLIWRLDNEIDEISDEIYVNNAGLVLAGPYLPRLFTMLGLLDESAFIDFQAAERGIHLLQYLVNGTTGAPEPLLVLNKLLCGVALETPVAGEVIITREEKETVDGLIAGMIQNWSVIGATSVDGFRESFLQREGALVLKDDEWRLLVEPRAYDLLLEHVPWGFSVIRHPWMTRAVHVEWRHGL